MTEKVPYRNGFLRKVCIIALTVSLLSTGISTYLWVNSIGDGHERGVQINANCEVLSILLLNRADRDETLKLFEPIRRQNPAQFDKLVRRAEKGDARLAKVQGDLACDVP